MSLEPKNIYIKKYGWGWEIVWFVLTGLRKLCSANTNFHWNPNIEAEFNNVKEMLKNKISLSPMDTKKESYVHCDASKEG